MLLPIVVFQRPSTSQSPSSLISATSQSVHGLRSCYLTICSVVDLCSLLPLLSLMSSAESICGPNSYLICVYTTVNKVCITYLGPSLSLSSLMHMSADKFYDHSDSILVWAHLLLWCPFTSAHVVCLPCQLPLYFACIESKCLYVPSSSSTPTPVFFAMSP